MSGCRPPTGPQKYRHSRCVGLAALWVGEAVVGGENFREGWKGFTLSLNSHIPSGMTGHPAPGWAFSQDPARPPPWGSVPDCVPPSSLAWVRRWPTEAQPDPGPLRSSRRACRPRPLCQRPATLIRSDRRVRKTGSVRGPACLVILFDTPCSYGEGGVDPVRHSCLFVDLFFVLSGLGLPGQALRRPRLR